ncbi:MAG: hypothetical protein MZW92_55635 [Comamonadaceae bacterium]|nr:hypothetical protein [Comamonadaceae bacterium]
MVGNERAPARSGEARVARTGAGRRIAVGRRAERRAGRPARTVQPDGPRPGSACRPRQAGGPPLARSRTVHWTVPVPGQPCRPRRAGGPPFAGADGPLDRRRPGSALQAAAGRCRASPGADGRQDRHRPGSALRSSRAASSAK